MKTDGDDGSFKVEMKQSVKFTLFKKITVILIKKYITNIINVTILKKKNSFVSFWSKGAAILQVPPHVMSQSWFAPMASIVISKTPKTFLINVENSCAA